jgi:hypothetical protein
MASVERVVILLQGCIFDACGSYHKLQTLQNIKTFAKHAHVKIQNLTFTLQIYTNSE